MKNQHLSEEQARRKAKLYMLDFYDALDKSIKRYPPCDYIEYCARRLKYCKNNTAAFVKTPPHNVLHSIEANCAFHRIEYSEPITWDGFARIMNVYHLHDNPYIIYAIQEDIDRVFMMLDRQQIALQQTASRCNMARVWGLFVNNPHMTHLPIEFETKYSLTMPQWVQLCILAYVAASKYLYFNQATFMQCHNYHPSTKAVESFIQYTSISPVQIKEHFMELKNSVASEFHFLNRSVFLDKPIIIFEDGRLIAPIPDLIFLYAGEGLYQMVQSLPSFSREIGHSFESYIESISKCLKGTVHSLDSKQLEAVSKGKCCDLLIECQNEILLIECKAVTFTVKTLTDKGISQNNSTTKIVQGLKQLIETAKYIVSGIYQPLGIPANKPIIGIVITLGKIPIVNSDWYYKNIINERANSGSIVLDYSDTNMKDRPIIMAIETFEELISVLNCEGTTMTSLCKEKMDQQYHVVGDWDTYLKPKVIKCREFLPCMIEYSNSFIASIGIDPGNIQLERMNPSEKQ